MEYLKKEINTVKNKITDVFNQNNNNLLPITNYDIIINSDKTLYSIKIEK